MKTGTSIYNPEYMSTPNPDQAIRHLALIPDGNRRWARSRGLSPLEGHRKAFLEKAPELLQHAWNKGIHTITLWMFSHDNWKRAPEEVAWLMELYEKFMHKAMDLAAEKQICLRHMGRRDLIPDSLRDTIIFAEHITRQHKKHELLFALDYSGRDELLRAISVAMRNPAPITPQKLESLLDTTGSRYPEPDIVIRTSGETRTSGFMPWQSIYSEYFFTTKYFPELQTSDIDEVLKAYHLRDRRYGG